MKTNFLASKKDRISFYLEQPDYSVERCLGTDCCLFVTLLQDVDYVFM